MAMRMGTHDRHAVRTNRVHARCPPVWAVQNLCYNRAMDKKTDAYIIRPNPQDPRLTERVSGIDQTGARIET